jgi:hypothetical protein
MNNAIEYDEVMQEIWRIKDENAVKYPTVAELFEHLKSVPWTGRTIQAPVLPPMPWMSQSTEQRV